MTDLLENLEMLHKLERAKHLTKNKVHWQPAPENEPQQHAYKVAMKVMQLGYGGQAGGGKTDLILGLAGTHFTNSLVVRNEYAQMQPIIKRGNEIFPARYISGEKKHWNFGQKTIRLGGIKDADSWTKYQGSSFDLFAVDEAAECKEQTVRYLMGWNRSVIPGQHTLTLFCFNPPTTPEGEWIVDYFAPWINPDHPNPAQPGEIRWFITVYEDGRERQMEVPDDQPYEHKGEIYLPISRTFIAASRHDNPFLGEKYERALFALPEPLRTMVMKGDFTLGKEDDAWQVIPTNWVLAAQARWEERQRPAVSMLTMGVDVAYGGNDRTVLAPLYGNYFDSLVTYPGRETHDGHVTANYIEQRHEGTAKVMIDVVSWGASAYDSAKVKPALRGLVYGVNWGVGSDARDISGKYEFKNLRAEIIWKFRTALDPNSGEDIALPPGRDVRVELCSYRYKTVAGKIQVESKEDIIKRIGRSPDKAEAILLAHYGTYGGATRKQMHWLD